MKKHYAPTSIKLAIKSETLRTISEATGEILVQVQGGREPTDGSTCKSNKTACG